jgi:hypothetical protein
VAQVKDIAQPNWSVLRDHWLNHVPADFVSEAVSVEELLRLSLVVTTDRTEIELVPGLRERTLEDIIYLRDKAIYCFDTTGALNQSGYSTWTALSMYDACFFAAKAFVYLLGFRDVGRSTKAYLQIFHQKHKKGKLIFDGHYSLIFKERMTHESLWDIFQRMVNAMQGTGATAELVKSLRKNDYEKFTKERNHIIYGTDTWSRRREIESSDLRNRVSYLSNVRYLATAGATGAEYVDKYYRTAQTVLNIVDEYLSDLGTLAPTISHHLVTWPSPPKVASVTFA